MIGIFDSGLGGLTVVRALRAKRPDLPLVYLGDTARTPYGAKSPETIRRYSEEAVAFLKKEGASAIIIACGTASANATEHLRETFPKLPIFEVVTPAVEAALRATKNGRIGVIATRATVMSGVYEQRLKAKGQGIEVFSNPAPLLVSLVEEGWLDTPETASIVGKYLAPIAGEGVDTLILGCTHYPFLKTAIAARMGDGVKLIDSAEAVTEAFCDTIERDSAIETALKKGKGSRYFVTDPSSSFAAIASEWLGEPIIISKTTL